MKQCRELVLLYSMLRGDMGNVKQCGEFVLLPSMLKRDMVGI